MIHSHLNGTRKKPKDTLAHNYRSSFCFSLLCKFRLMKKKTKQKNKNLVSKLMHEASQCQVIRTFLRESEMAFALKNSTSPLSVSVITL